VRDCLLLARSGPLRTSASPSLTGADRTFVRYAEADAVHPERTSLPIDDMVGCALSGGLATGFVPPKRGGRRGPSFSCPRQHARGRIPPSTREYSRLWALCKTGLGFLNQCYRGMRKANWQRVRSGDRSPAAEPETPSAPSLTDRRCRSRRYFPLSRWRSSGRNWSFPNNSSVGSG
jgi:hypothetical protein